MTTPRGRFPRDRRRPTTLAANACLLGCTLCVVTAPNTARAETTGGDIARVVIASTLTAGGIAGTAIGGALAADEVDTIEAHCPDRVCDREGYDAVKRGQTAGGIATVSAFLGGAAAVWLTIELVSLGSDAGEPEPDPDAPEPEGPAPIAPVKAHLDLGVVPVAGGAGVALELAF